jgi:hypothetical protein
LSREIGCFQSKVLLGIVNCKDFPAILSKNNRREISGDISLPLALLALQ